MSSGTTDPYKFALNAAYDPPATGPWTEGDEDDHARLPSLDTNCNCKMHALVQKFDKKEENPLISDREVDRLQRVFDTYGQMDPDFPPAMIVEFLKYGYLIELAFERVFYWAVLPNIAVDGDPSRTLLPPDIMTVYRDFDKGSELNHILLSKWRRLTFILMPNGLKRHQASPQLKKNMVKIRKFLVQLFGPYFLKTSVLGKFSANVDDLIASVVVLGYELMAYAGEYRFDWHWWAPLTKTCGTYRVGTPLPVEGSDRPKPGALVVKPALVKVRFATGELLEIPETYVAITWDTIEEEGLLQLMVERDDTEEGGPTNDKSERRPLSDQD